MNRPSKLSWYCAFWEYSTNDKTPYHKIHLHLVYINRHRFHWQPRVDWEDSIRLYYIIDYYIYIIIFLLNDFWILSK